MLCISNGQNPLGPLGKKPLAGYAAAARRRDEFKYQL